MTYYHRLSQFCVSNGVEVQRRLHLCDFLKWDVLCRHNKQRFCRQNMFCRKKTSKFHGNVLACLNQFRIRNTQLKILLVLGGQVYRFLCGRSGLKGLRPFHTSPTIDDIYRHCVLSSQVVWVGLYGAWWIFCISATKATSLWMMSYDESFKGRINHSAIYAMA